MSVPYSALSLHDVKEVCETCMTRYKVYNMSWNKNKIKVVVNDARSVVFYMKSGQALRLLYKDIMRVELRSCRKIAFVLSDKDIVISGFRSKSMFKQLRESLNNQLIVREY